MKQYLEQGQSFLRILVAKGLTLESKTGSNTYI